MAKKSKGMVLYEVIRQNQARAMGGEKTQEVRPKKREKKLETPQNDEIAFGSPRQRPGNHWPPRTPGLKNALLRSQLARRLRIIIDPARLKALLIVIMVMIIAVKSIQFFIGTPPEVVDLTAQQVKDVPEAVDVVQPDAEVPQVADEEKEFIDQADVLAPMGDHTIVIMTYGEKKDLAPARDYFQENGIETRIEKRGVYYFLLTVDRFMSPKRTGTDGHDALKRIKQIGAEYKAPPGFETFGEKPFQDAYGMKIK